MFRSNMATSMTSAGVGSESRLTCPPKSTAGSNKRINALLVDEIQKLGCPDLADFLLFRASECPYFIEFLENLSGNY
jgi:hypothetical protein